VVRPHAADEIRYVLSQLDALPAERRPKGPPVLLWIGLDDLIRGLADA